MCPPSQSQEQFQEQCQQQETRGLCESNFQVKFQEKSDIVLIKPPKCIDGSNFFPDGGRGILNADLNRWSNGKSECQEKGNSIYLKYEFSSHESNLCDFYQDNMCT